MDRRELDAELFGFHVLDVIKCNRAQQPHNLCQLVGRALSVKDGSVDRHFSDNAGGRPHIDLVGVLDSAKDKLWSSVVP